MADPLAAAIQEEKTVEPQASAVAHLANLIAGSQGISTTQAILARGLGHLYFLYPELVVAEIKSCGLQYLLQHYPVIIDAVFCDTVLDQLDGKEIVKVISDLRNHATGNPGIKYPDRLVEKLRERNFDYASRLNDFTTPSNQTDNVGDVFSLLSLRRQGA